MEKMQSKLEHIIGVFGFGLVVVLLDVLVVMVVGLVGGDGC